MKWFGPVIGLYLCVLVGPIQAQEREARARFEEANDALSSGRFAEARDLFRRSLQAHPNAAAAFNLAVALRGTGETVESVEVFDALLAGAYGALREQQRREAQGLRAETQAEIAVLQIRATGPPRTDVRIDGRRAGVVGSTDVLEAPVNAGAHVVIGTATEYEIAEQRVSVARGELAQLQLTLEPSEPPPIRTRIVEASTPSIFESPWLWVGVGAGVAALVVGALLLFVTVEQDPLTDPVYGVIATLR